MAHLSLYRKYRPQNFGEVVGQQHVTQTLQTAIKQDRLAHALLFSGPRGTGKTSTARILAKALNCERDGDEPCGECSSCLSITSGSSLDVVEIDAASHGSVDDARDLREKVAYASYAGRWKVYIIDECHMLSPAANNALLKVLEEPPSHVVFVFATTEPHKVLQTVLDRCQRYEFRSINSLDTAGRLSQICELEAINADPETLTLISSRAGGSMRDALSLLDQLRAFAGDTVAVGDLAQLLGRMPDEVLFEAIDLISERDIGAVFVFAERLIRSGVDIREFSRALTDHLRSLFLVLHAPAAREILEVTDDGLTRLQEQANHLGSAEVLRLIDLTNEIGLQLRQAVEGRLALEVGLARMTRPDLHATPASLLARLERLERNQGDAPMGAASMPMPRMAPPEGRAPRPEPARAAVAVRPPVAAKPPAAPEPPGAAPAAGPSAPAPPPSVPEAAESDAPPEIGAGWLWGSDDAPARPAAAAKPPTPPAKAPYPEPAATAPRHAAAPATSPPSAAAPPPPAVQTQPPAAPSRPAAPAPLPPASPAPVADNAPSPAPETAASPSPAAGARTPVPAGELDLETIVRAWPLIRDKVKRRKISFHAVLLPAEPVAWRNGELVLEFGPRSRFHRDKVADQTQNGPLLEAFKEILGVTPRLNCVIGAEPAAQNPASDPAGTPPDDAGGPSDSDGTEPPEDAIELIRRAFKGTVVVEDP
ncbi:MAG TPA: DNA polymerase III subunit gamma/tau [Actinomycetota bacterium]|nr:DNA polymerase III subunit gamma/tau [Actinomycetota bacterium]